MEEDVKVIYDIKSLPEQCSFEDAYNVMKNSGIVVWDSDNKGHEPRIIDLKLKSVDVRLFTKDEFEERFIDTLGTKKL